MIPSDRPHRHNILKTEHAKDFLTFRLDYFIAAVTLFIVEVCIALFFHDRFIRPYVGDFLAVIFLYALLKSFFNLTVIRACLIVLAIAYFIELLQYFNFVERIGLQHVLLVRTIFGYAFEWKDILAYTLGITVVLAAEWFRKRG